MDRKFSIYHNVIIKAPANKVFEAITVPFHLDNWWPLQSSGKPIIGEEYNLNFTDQYN